MRNVFVAGHNGMVGSSVVRRLKNDSDVNVVTVSKQELDLRDQVKVFNFFKDVKVDEVVLAAAKVGGIVANSTYGAEFLNDNISIQTNVIHGAYQGGVKRLLFLGSSCIYPRLAPQPIKEEYLLTSALEPTNEPYALAKIVGLKMCQYYRKQYGVLYHSLMPTNLYGVGDNYHPNNSHVIPGLIYKFHKAKTENTPFVEAWGTGTPLREFLYVDDLATVITNILKLDEPPDWVNVGSNDEVTIKDLTELISSVVGYKGVVKFDASKPDGTPRKKLDNSMLHKLTPVEYTNLRVGLETAYSDYLKKYIFD